MHMYVLYVNVHVVCTRLLKCSVCMYACLYVCMCVCLTMLSELTCTHIYPYVCIYIHTQTHTACSVTHTHIHTHNTHIHIHTYTHTHTAGPQRRTRHRAHRYQPHTPIPRRHPTLKHTRHITVYSSAEKLRKYAE
jgi:hypothetical protein